MKSHAIFPPELTKGPLVRNTRWMIGERILDTVQLTLSSERSRNNCAVAKNSNAVRISETLLHCLSTKKVFCGLPTTLSVTTHGDFPHNLSLRKTLQRQRKRCQHRSAFSKKVTRAGATCLRLAATFPCVNTERQCAPGTSNT